MDLLSSFRGNSDHKLLSYGDTTITRGEFLAKVEAYAERFGELPDLSPDGLTVLVNENPLEFLPQVFALWTLNIGVVFPTRDFLAERAQFQFPKMILRTSGDDFQLQYNQHFQAIEFPLEKTDVVVFSSGSTGTPKGICHSAQHFLDNAQSVHQLIGGESYASVTPLKPYLVSAFSHFLVHALSSSHLVFIDNNDLPSLKELYDSDPSLALVGSPMHVLTGFQYIPEQATPRYFFTSGDFMYRGSISQIMAKFPQCAFYKVYGLAELAGRYYINKIDSQTSEDSYEELGQRIRGTESEIREGHLHVASEFLFWGYLRDDTFTVSETPHPTSDLVIENEHGVFLAGRTNDEVKVAGNKVSLRHLEGRISGLLQDDTPVVVATPHPVFGNLLSLVIKTSKSYSRSHLMDQLRTVLEKHEMPHHYYATEQLPFTQSQKIDRQALGSQLSEFTKISDASP